MKLQQGRARLSLKRGKWVERLSDFVQYKEYSKNHLQFHKYLLSYH